MHVDIPGLAATLRRATSEFAGVTYQPKGGLFPLPDNVQLKRAARSVAHGTVLSVGYVGSVSRHLWTQGDINPPKCLTFPDCTALATDSNVPPDRFGRDVHRHST